MSRLIFLDDPQRAALELPEGESTLGRRPTNDIQMNHETSLAGMQRFLLPTIAFV